MKGRAVVLGPLLGGEAAALMVDGRLEDLILDASRCLPFAPGAILRGTVGRLVKGQGSVFLRLPGGETGYLRDRNHLSEGQVLLVQVSGVAEPGKAVPLTARLLFRGRWAIVTPGAEGVNVSRSIRDPEARARLTVLGEAAMARLPGAGAILRSAAETADEEEIRDELAALADLTARVLADATGAPELLVDGPDPAEAAWRDWAEPAPDSLEEGPEAFADSGALDAVEALLEPRLALPGGGHATIESTQALVAVDVNTGADTSAAAALKANIALARDLPRQLRLRGLGGQVVVDFAPMPKRDRGTLEQVLRAGFRQDGAETTLVGWTAMGLYELTRKRDRVPLARWLEGGR